MDVFDKFFQRYSYKFPKGYPDMNDPNDVLLLEQILNNIGFNSLSETYYSSVLTTAELKKNRTPNRGDIILFKINNQSPYNNNFLTISGEKVELEFISDEIKNIFLNKEWNKITNNTTLFKDKNNNKYTLIDIVKTNEFGGKEKGASVRKETSALNQGNIELQKILSDENLESITILVGDKYYNGCKSIINQPKTPKSDFNIISNEGPEIFISHKDGNTPKDFIRWGGYSKYINHPEVLYFKNKIIEQTNGELKSKDSFYKKINDTDLKKKIVFGSDFGNSYGINNVTCVIQGNIKFDKIDNGVYKLNGDKIWLNGELPEELYEPILFASYRDNRNDLGIKNCSAISTPAARIRSITKEIK